MNLKATLRKMKNKLLPQGIGGSENNLYNELLGGFVKDKFSRQNYLTRIVKKRGYRRIMEIGVARGGGGQKADIFRLK